MAWERTEVLEFAGLLRSLFMDLRDFDQLRPPMAPEEVLAGFLGVLGFELLHCIPGVYLNREARPGLRSSRAPGDWTARQAVRLAGHK